MNSGKLSETKPELPAFIIHNESSRENKKMYALLTQIMQQAPASETARLFFRRHHFPAAAQRFINGDQRGRRSGFALGQLALVLQQS
jgi:hypothetical protein